MDFLLHFSARLYRNKNKTRKKKTGHLYDDDCRFMDSEENNQKIINAERLSLS